MYDIQALPGPSNSDSEAHGISSSGHVAGIAYPIDADGHLHIVGAVWEGGHLGFTLPLLSESQVAWQHTGWYDCQQRHPRQHNEGHFQCLQTRLRIDATSPR